ncbi:MAG TPA: 1-deoxy-D-xylulose-5-phosphate reductoisomerase [Casimicrobiaceae bacterium]|nr:1-deoxy-D-xylulose-5-phosphate reductoisomerase [Casimicrobiaceae bacterium]
MTDPRRITVLGATGSIGASTLDVIARHPGRFAVAALAAHRRWPAMLELIERFRPACAAMLDPQAARQLDEAVKREGLPTRIVAGAEGLCEAAALEDVDTVVAGIVGAAGLASTLAAASAGKRILLANKETLVIAGGIFMTAVRDCGATLLPIDSEHNAIFQCLPAGRDGSRGRDGVRRILLTASGGPFRTTPASELARVTPEQACAHPRWRMGRKISIDSATMMNKGLETIEARWLFGLAPDEIEILVHPESIVHSLVEYRDGSVLAQLGNPDMRTPIAHALAWPDRVEAGITPLDLAQVGALSFAAPDPERFPCLALARQALVAGGTAPAILNAANEIAVAAFLEREIGFLDIADICAEALSQLPARPVTSLDDALEADRASRTLSLELASRHALSV